MPIPLSLSSDGYYVAFSGGKDSIVMERLFKMAGVKYKAWYNNVTIDPPELVQFIKREYPEVEWNNTGRNLPGMMADKSAGPPTRLIRWCCEIYKEQGGLDKFRAIGVRAEESARRKGNWVQLAKDRRNGNPILCPILYWTEADIWQFIRDNDMPYCSLYDEVDAKGEKLFKRLGCVGCPMGGPKGMAKDFERWPKYRQMWRRGFHAFWLKYKGVPRTKKSTCPQCEGVGKVLVMTDAEEVTITCLNCDGSGKVFGPRALEKFPTEQALWDWWVSGKAYEGEGADCQQFLW